MGQRNMIQGWRTALVGVCLTALVQPLTAQPLSPEEQLQAIRQSLVQLALDGPTEVRNTTWLDDQGRLQDSSSFRTGMTVRDVRIMAYGRDTEQQVTAKQQAFFRIAFGIHTKIGTSLVMPARPPIDFQRGGKMTPEFRAEIVKAARASLLEVQQKSGLSKLLGEKASFQQLTNRLSR